MKKTIRLGSVIGILGLSFFGGAAQAAQLGILGSASIPESNNVGENSPSMLLGGELTFGPSVASIGLFFDHNFLSYPGGGSSSLNFYGVVGRVQLPLTPIFIDAKVGAESYGGNTATDIGFGAGLGLKLSLAPGVDVSPRVGYRYLPIDYSGGATFSAGLLDIGLLLQFGF